MVPKIPYPNISTLLLKANSDEFSSQKLLSDSLKQANGQYNYSAALATSELHE
jgi:hypothetical protein